MDIKLKLMEGEIAVAKLKAGAPIPGWALSGAWFSVTKTEDELSIAAESSRIPPGITSEGGWRTLKICGTLDFAETGIISGISAVLAQSGISVFVISTYNTDYILIKNAGLEDALGALGQSGYDIQI